MTESSPNGPVTSPGAAYDEAPYPSSSFPETHPDKLCAMGRLFGLNVPAPAEARVLELGCADGANLLPMAQHAPNARFLGIDASARHVEAAQAAIAGAGLTNVEIRQQNILEFPASEGKFDYIIVHGLFSWVPEEVREKILAICREHLSENGIAYISYNAFPGWGMRMALREMMLFHTAGFPEPTAKVKQARALTAFLADSVPTDNPYGLLLKKEMEAMKAMPDNYLRHDILGEINQPFYFHEFIGRALRSGLQYLSESSLHQMLASNFPAKVAETLDKVTGNIVAKEQYMDFVRNRNFRRTLLCRQGVKLVRQLTPESIKSFYFTSLIAKPAPGTLDLKPGLRHVFKLRSGNELSVNADNSFVKAVFDTLAECGLKRISFQELLEAARGKNAAVSELATSPDRAALEEAMLTANLLPLYMRGILEIYADRPRFLSSLPEKPAVTPLVRYQAMHSHVVTNWAHRAVPFETVGRYIVAACNGENDLNGIVQSLMTAAKDGKLRVLDKDKPIESEEALRAVLTERVKSTVLQIAALGFLAE